MPPPDLDRELDHVAAVRTRVGVVGLDDVSEQHRRAAIGLRELERLVDPRSGARWRTRAAAARAAGTPRPAPTRARRRRSPSRRRAAPAADRRRRPTRRRATAAPAASPYASRANTIELDEVGERRRRRAQRAIAGQSVQTRPAPRSARTAAGASTGSETCATAGSDTRDVPCPRATLTRRAEGSAGRRRTTGSAPEAARPASPPAPPRCSRCGPARPRTPRARRSA